jgi:hypothetical protein
LAGARVVPPKDEDKDYQVPFKFTGKLNKLTLKIDRPKLSLEDERRLREAQRNLSLAGAVRGAFVSAATQKDNVNAEVGSCAAYSGLPEGSGDTAWMVFIRGGTFVMGSERHRNASPTPCASRVFGSIAMR